MVAQRGDGLATLNVCAEIFGATAFRSAFDSSATAIEGLLEARADLKMDDARRARVKLGTGRRLDGTFGAPDWRIVLAVEVVGNTGPSK
jgi:hypothetical protein